jgi:7-cyano-7-deazaguanine synthase
LAPDQSATVSNPRTRQLDRNVVGPADVAVLYSGGIDSAVLLAELVKRGQRVAPIYVRSDCIWQTSELRAARQFIAALAQPNLCDLVELAMPLGDLYAGHWSMTGRGVPDRSSPDEAVFLPGRNPLLLVKPVLWCQTNGVGQLALATLVSNPFDDATPEFFARFQEAMTAATGQPIEIVRPFENLSKQAVMQMGQHLPLELTFSCLAPVKGAHCGRCNKCAERQTAFAHLSTGDPTHYAASARAARA